MCKEHKKGEKTAFLPNIISASILGIKVLHYQANVYIRIYKTKYNIENIIHKIQNTI
jgi:hypothetical protein